MAGKKSTGNAGAERMTTSAGGIVVTKKGGAGNKAPAPKRTGGKAKGGK